jgi:hypothetical protein
MNAPRVLPDRSPSAAAAPPAYRLPTALSRQIRSDLIRLGSIALLVFLLAIILPTGTWLQLALQLQDYHIDDFIVGRSALGRGCTLTA